MCKRRVGCVGSVWVCGAKSVGDFGQGMGFRSALSSGYLGKSGHLPRCYSTRNMKFFYVLILFLLGSSTEACKSNSLVRPGLNDLDTDLIWQEGPC